MVSRKKTHFPNFVWNAAKEILRPSPVSPIIAAFPSAQEHSEIFQWVNSAISLVSIQKWGILENLKNHRPGCDAKLHDIRAFFESVVIQLDHFTHNFKHFYPACYGSFTMSLSFRYVSENCFLARVKRFAETMDAHT